MGLLEGLLTRVPAKAAVGRGADMVAHGVPLFTTLSDPASRAATALAAYRWSPYIRQAERAIKSRLATIPWWLEDEDGERVTDESRPELVAVRDGLEMPYRPEPGDPESPTPKTRAGLWDLTLRHMGCAGVGFWYLDGIDALAGTPLQTLYISPARMTPDLNDQGLLSGWWMDYRSRRPTHFELREIIPFYLEPADEGFLPTGLVDTALAKAELARMGDRHAMHSMASGGRRPGIYHPPAGGTIPDEVFEGLKRDLRAIVEAPDSAKRSMILKGPVEFDPTDQTVSEMNLLEIMAMARDDIAALWGVPKSQMGYERPSGIGDSSVDKDYEALWHGALGPRIRSFQETLQTQYLDRYARLGITLTMHFDIPEFDDEAPLYEMAQKSAGVPMRTAERRALIGLEPFGDPLLDDAIVMPINITTVGQAPPADPGDMEAGKARLDKDTDALADALARFLEDQKERIAKRIERNAGHLARKPKDEDAWWNQKEEDEALAKVLQPYVTDAALEAAEQASRRLNG